MLTSRQLAYPLGSIFCHEARPAPKLCLDEANFAISPFKSEPKQASGLNGESCGDESQGLRYLTPLQGLRGTWLLILPLSLRHSHKLPQLSIIDPSHRFRHYLRVIPALFLFSTILIILKDVGKITEFLETMVGDLARRRQRNLRNKQWHQHRASEFRQQRHTIERQQQEIEFLKDQLRQSQNQVRKFEDHTLDENLDPNGNEMTRQSQLPDTPISEGAAPTPFTSELNFRVHTTKFEPGSIVATISHKCPEYWGSVILPLLSHVTFLGCNCVEVKDRYTIFRSDQYEVYIAFQDHGAQPFWHRLWSAAVVSLPIILDLLHRHPTGFSHSDRERETLIRVVDYVHDLESTYLHQFLSLPSSPFHGLYSTILALQYRAKSLPLRKCKYTKEQEECPACLKEVSIAFNGFLVIFSLERVTGQAQPLWVILASSTTLEVAGIRFEREIVS